ncbi:hypothetical protein H312_01796 [Anncaliia algerae PRA339]|uniref:Uncharacterized protein n=1 Tax=Anncaliia algerae PRA339 TaxID=1288291 RepID=A0A059F1A5_9MICR|nr:hypothetical protein H312_01796 [Anncaliia algerae PRA339]
MIKFILLNIFLTTKNTGNSENLARFYSMQERNDNILPVDFICGNNIYKNPCISKKNSLCFNILADNSSLERINSTIECNETDVDLRELKYLTENNNISSIIDCTIPKNLYFYEEHMSLICLFLILSLLFIIFYLILLFYRKNMITKRKKYILYKNIRDNFEEISLNE